MSEPAMPNFSAPVSDPPEVAEADKQEAPANPNPGEQAPANDEAGKAGETPAAPGEQSKEGETPTPPAQPTQQFTELIEGWREDRKALDELTLKNRELEDQLSKVRQPDEDEEFEGLSEREKVDRIIAKRDEEAKTAEEKEKTEVEGEIRFYEKTDPFFRDHKEEVVKIAADFNAKNLAQAITILKSQYVAAGKATGDAQYNDARKKNAAGVGGGNAGGQPATKPYDAKTDGRKSFGDLYREAGVA